jgi:hypothetical protein
MSPEPKINDQFWFDLSEGMVKNSVDNLNKSYDNINTMIIWGWGIYTGSSIFTIEYKKITEWWILAILVMPYLLFIFTYWKSIIGKNPVSIKFDGRSPDEIKEAYELTFESKQRELKWLTNSSFITMTLLAMALITAYCLKNSQKEITLEENVLIGKEDIASQALHLSGKFPPDSILSIHLQIMALDTSSQNVDTTFALLNTHEGVFYYTVKTEKTTPKVIAGISWNDKGTKMTLERAFIINASKKTVKKP